LDHSSVSALAAAVSAICDKRVPVSCVKIDLSGLRFVDVPGARRFGGEIDSG
jgi:hypothetical protein